VSACPSCGLESAPEAVFCSKCGTRLTPAVSTADERKVVTTLFCDLVGFTSMSESADPEEVDAVLRVYNDSARRAIERHGGTVEKFIGDAVVGVFGVPLAREDDARRAVGAGLDIIRAMGVLMRPDGSPLQARVGINTGRVLLHGDVAPESGEGFLVGDAVNTAARLQSAAPPMGVVVGAMTHRLTRSTFTSDELAPLALKGKSARVKAWLVKGHARQAEHSASVRSPMVGREAKLDACVAAVGRLVDGHGGLLLITGEAGIGKTRLVEELRGIAQERGCAWLEGRTLSFGRSISYWPFLKILQQDAGIEIDDEEQERSAKLASRVSALFGDESADVLPYLATLLGLPVPARLADRVRFADGEAMGRQVYRAIRLYVSRLADRQPLTLVFEDLHWMDESSAALLEHLLPLQREVPLLIVGVARPEMGTPLAWLREAARSQYADRASEVFVGALTSEDSAVLVRNLTTLDEIPADLRRAIAVKAEGNPLFVEEIVRSLIDQGGLVPTREGYYRLTEDAARIAIPDTLLGVIMARIDRLDEELKQVLRLASVIGRSFFYRLLAALSDADRALDQSLAGLEARELVLEKARDPELEYIFKHALVQEATYESILMKRRRDLHRRVAASIESLFANRVEDFYGVLAYHYTKAEDWEKAQEYLLKAGDQAGSIAADAEALAHYQDAMDAYTRAFGDTWDPLEKAALERKVGEGLYRRGEQAQASEFLFRALATLGSPFPASPGAMRRSIVQQSVRQLWHRLFPWFQPRVTTPEAVRVVEERCRVYYALVWTNMFADVNVWLLGLLLLLNEGERARLEWAASGGASGMAMLSHTIPSRWLFRVYIRRARALAGQGGLDYQLAQAALVTGMYKYWTEGDLAAALRSCRQAADLYRDLGDTRLWATAMGLATYVPAERGELAQALATSREMTQLGMETGDHLTEVWGRAWEAELLYLAGELSAGEEGMRRTVEAMLAMMDYRIAGKVAGRLAACYLAQDKLEEAQALLGEHRALLRKYGIRGGNASSVILGSAAAALATAERADGAAREERLRKARRVCRAALRQANVDATAIVPAARLRGTFEWLRGRPRRAEKWWRRSLDHAGRIGCRYEGALTMLEMGRRLGNRGQLERAEHSFAEMGAEFCLAETRELLGRTAAMPLTPSG
jgi:class 3 adenylate cyclase